MDLLTHIKRLYYLIRKSVPSQAGQAGKVLTTDGTKTSWSTISGGGDPLTLQQVTDNGNSTTNRILFGENPDYQSIGKGTVDTGFNGGVSMFCTVGYELNWQGGILSNYTTGEALDNFRILTPNFTIYEPNYNTILSSTNVSFNSNATSVEGVNSQVSHYVDGVIGESNFVFTSGNTGQYFGLKVFFSEGDSNQNTLSIGEIGANNFTHILIDDNSQKVDINSQTINLNAQYLHLPLANYDVGKVLTSDGDGNATWQTPSGGSSLLGITQEDTPGKLKHVDEYWTISETGASTFITVQAQKFFSNGPDGAFNINLLLMPETGLPRITFDIEDTERLSLDNSGKLSNGTWYINNDGTNNLPSSGSSGLVNVFNDDGNLYNYNNEIENSAWDIQSNGSARFNTYVYSPIFGNYGYDGFTGTEINGSPSFIDPAYPNITFKIGDVDRLTINNLGKLFNDNWYINSDGTNNLPVSLPYKIYTALLTQSGGDDLYYISTGTLTIGVTYTINNTSTGMDFTNVGAPNNEVGTSFVATGEVPNNWGTEEGTSNNTLGYNLGAPTVKVLENSLGNIYFQFISDGTYSIKSNENLFTANKTGVPGILSPTTDGIIYGFRVSDNEIYLITSIVPATSQNNMLIDTFIEIRVYN